MHFTTLFQLTALAALLDPILAQLWNISAYETDTCAQTSLFFEEVRMDANLDNPCYSFGTLAKSAQWNGGNYWCGRLYNTTDCSGQSSIFLENGASGCQSGTYGSFTALDEGWLAAKML
ncbi:MAG: hypothetical protein LQ350_001351 [Teloschistes chrysophthalmus]|nr:MAG: hypothetical protein LQ350_001351 [Niorma chrysophthalma]